MRICIFEDDQTLSTALSKTLCPLADITATKTLAELQNNLDNDLFLVDIYFENKPLGIDAIRTIKKFSKEKKVWIMSADKFINTKLRMYELGADDYITKPFYKEEIEAKIKAFKRNNSRPKIDLHLTKTENQIVEVLREAKAYLSKEKINAKLWPGSKCTTNKVVVHIKNINNKSINKYNCPLIKASYGMGYRIQTKVEQHHQE